MQRRHSVTPLFVLPYLDGFSKRYNNILCTYLLRIGFGLKKTGPNIKSGPASQEQYKCLVRIIDIKFNWVRRVFKTDHILHLQINISIDLIVSEHIALSQVATVFVQ